MKTEPAKKTGITTETMQLTELTQEQKERMLEAGRIMAQVLHDAFPDSGGLQWSALMNFVSQWFTLSTMGTERELRKKRLEDSLKILLNQFETNIEKVEKSAKEGAYRLKEARRIAG